MKPVVSVVIPTLDAERYLGRCLDSIATQPDGVEVIVVDQASRDATVDVAIRGGARLITLRRPRYYTPPARSRNLGARAATGTFLLHLDADMALSRGTLSQCVALCEDEGCVAVVLEEIDVARGFWASCKALERRAYREARALEAARFVSTRTFWEVDGYDEAIRSGEDWDIHARYLQAGRVCRVERAVVHDLGATSFFGQVGKKFAYGRSARSFLAKHGASSYAGSALRSYWAARRCLFSHPLLAAGTAALRVSEAIALVAGVGFEGAASVARRRVSRATRDA